MNLPPSAPRSYVTGPYLDYQRRYTKEPAERDKVLLRLLDEEIRRREAYDEQLSVLDIGCSNGNLLRFLKEAYPRFSLNGGDLFPEMVERVSRDPTLSGIHFEVMDVRDIGRKSNYDIVIANAVLFRFDDSVYAKACANIATALREGGSLFALDYHHPYDQHLTIVERSEPHPEGLTLHFRPIQWTERALKESGFSDVVFEPFAIPIDLPCVDDDGGIRTHTRQTDDGERLQFRGAIYQPWCHLIAHKR